MLQALIDKSQEHVEGTVRLKLYKGSVRVVGRKSPKSLYSLAHVTFEADQVYDQRDAGGFTGYRAPEAHLEDLPAELGETAASAEVHGRLVLAPGPPRPAAWVANI